MVKTRSFYGKLKKMNKDELKNTGYKPFPEVKRKKPANSKERAKLVKRIQESLADQEAYIEKEEKQQNYYYPGRSILQLS